MPVGEKTPNGAHWIEEGHRKTTVLMYACQQGDFGRVKELLKKEPSLTLRQDRTLKTALHYCAGRERDSTHCADLLVMAAPGLVDTRDEDGFTPLHLAVIAGNMQLVNFLLANGAEVNALDSERHSVVHWATVCGEAASLCAVLAAGAEVSTPDVHGGFPLHYAAQMCGSERDQLGLQVLHILLSQSSCNVSVADNDGRQPLLWAASAGSAKAVLALVRAGAAVEAPDKDGLTALHCAASRGHTDCLDTLLTLCGATPDVIDTNGCTALHYAVTLGHADATALLLNHSSDPNRQDRKGRTPAHCGCAKGQLETVKLLGTHSANLWLRNARGDLPLHEAASSGRRDLVRWLLDQRPSQVNARNNDGRCALHLAALNDNSDMCKILLDAGAFVNPVLRTSKNILMTPLDCAMQRGFRSTAKFLQLHGGLPANRLSTLKVGSEISTSIPLSSNLHIREDITVLGGSSSETDVDERKDTRPRRRSIRRRVAYRYGRSKDSLSDEDTQHRAKGKAAKADKTLSHDKSDDHEKLKDDEKRKSRDDINKADDTIQEGVKTEDITKTEIEKPEGQEKITRQRPKSAKKRPDSKRKSSAEVSAPATVEGTVTTEKEYENGYINNVQLDQSPRLKSDDEQSKTLVVEAAVHMPPKEVDKQIIEQQKSETPPDAKTIEPPQEKANGDNNGKVDTAITVHDTSKDAEDAKEGVSKEEIQKEAEVKTADVSKIEAVVEEKKIELTKEESKEKEVDTKTQKETALQGSPKEDKDVSEKEQKDLKEEPEKQTDVDVKKEDEINEKPSGEEEKVDEAKTEQKETEKESPKEEIKSETNEKETTTIEETATTTEITTNGTVKTEKTDTKTETSEITIKEGIEQTTEQTTEQSEDKRSNELNIDLSLKKFEESADVSDSTDAKIEKPKRHKKRHKPDEAQNESSSEESARRNLSRSSDHKSFQIIDEEASFQVVDENVLKETKRTKRRSSKVHLEPESSPEGLDVRSRSISREKERKVHSSLDTHITLPALSDKTRSESNLSAPHLGSVYSDNEHKSESNTDEMDDVISSGSRKKRFKRRSKRLGSKSAGSDYESSVLIDSGFEPSPRSSRIPKRKVMSERGVNMTSVTQSIQTNIRRYHMERKIFQHLLDLKRLQIRSGQANEAVLVKRAIDTYHSSIAATVGAGRYSKKDYTYRSFEQFLYQSLRMIQRGANENLKGLPETSDNPLLCTQSTHRCLHATHAYTGIPCAAYITKLNHHTMPKVGFSSKSQSFLPQINSKGKAVTLELCHGNDKQVISLPADRLDQNKRYYVTFTVKGQDSQTQSEQGSATHRHAKSV